MISVVIPEAEQRLSGIHIPGVSDIETLGLWIPGSLAALAPRNDRM
jgi:hypothetical protein